MRTIRAAVPWALTLCVAACGGGGPTAPAGDVPEPPVAGTSVQRFDFQPAGGTVEPGATPLTPEDLYSAERGHGFVIAPGTATDGTRHAWSVFGRTVTVDQAVPASVLSASTIDCVGGSGVGGGRTQRLQTESFTFRADVEPGEYDVTLWLGDVTTPLLPGARDRERRRGRRGADGREQLARPVRPVRLRQRGPVHRARRRARRLSRSPGRPAPGRGRPIEWTYEQDEDPKNPPSTRTATLVPAYQAVRAAGPDAAPRRRPAAGPEGGTLVRGSAPDEAGLDGALALFNAGDVEGARDAFEAPRRPARRGARGLFWVAGHPALVDDEPELLAGPRPCSIAARGRRPRGGAISCCRSAWPGTPSATGASTATRPPGRPRRTTWAAPAALVETFPPDHPYHLKGQILWLRNRGGLDPRRVHGLLGAGAVAGAAARSRRGATSIRTSTSTRPTSGTTTGARGPSSTGPPSPAPAPTGRARS